MTKSTPPKKVSKHTQDTAHASSVAQHSLLKQFLHSHGHAILAFAYALQALLIVLLAKTYTLTVTATFVAKDTLATNAAGETVLAPASRHFAEVHVAYAVAAVMLVASVTHLVLSIIRKRDAWSESTIRRHGRRVRWTGMTLSIVGLVVVVAMLLGIRDVAALAALKGLVVLAGVVGYLVEEHQKISRRIILLLGVISTVLPALILATTTLLVGMYGDLPTSLLAISLTLLLGALIAFAAFYFVVIAKKPVHFSVAAYSVVLIFVVESAVIWQIFASYLRS